MGGSPPTIVKYYGLHINWWVLIGAAIVAGIIYYAYVNSGGTSTELPISDNPVSLPAGTIT
jgi:hypothetical protein